MYLSTVLSLLTLLPAVVLGVPKDYTKNKCLKPLVRKEWRTLCDTEKWEYIEAVKCLQKLPGISTASTPGAITRFDDFQGAHIRDAPAAHQVAYFHHWHRYFVWTYEQALREECGYKGAQPFWDWTLDSGSEEDWLKSPVWDPKTGFGGNGPLDTTTVNPYFKIPGHTGGGCVQDGPFKDMVLHLGPFNNITDRPHCLTRDITPYIAVNYVNKKVISEVLKQKTWGWFDYLAQRGVHQGYMTVSELTYHAGGHTAAGGELGTVSDNFAAPGDPLFYIHHANVDRMFSAWQHLDVEKRFSEVEGTMTAFAPPFGPEVSAGNVTLDFEIGLHEVGRNVTLEELLYHPGGFLCYVYEGVYPKWDKEDKKCHGGGGWGVDVDVEC